MATIIAEEPLIRVFDMIIERLTSLETSIQQVEKSINQLKEYSIKSMFYQNTPGKSLGTLFGFPGAIITWNDKMSDDTDGQTMFYAVYIEIAAENSTLTDVGLYDLVGSHENRNPLCGRLRDFVSRTMPEDKLQRLQSDIISHRDDADAISVWENNVLQPIDYDLHEFWHMSAYDAILGDYMTSHVHNIIAFSKWEESVSIVVRAHNNHDIIDSVRLTMNELSIDLKCVSSIECTRVSPEFSRLYHILSAVYANRTQTITAVKNILDDIRSRSNSKYLDLIKEIKSQKTRSHCYLSVTEFFKDNEHLLTQQNE